MIRTTVVKLTVIPALAYRSKLQAGDNAVTILRQGVKQPGIASISKSTGEPVLAKNTPADQYPLEAFKEAIAMTNGMPYRKQRPIKVSDVDLAFVEVEEPVEEIKEVVIDSAEYQMIVDQYTDKNGRLSYDLLNRDFIQFAHKSSIVRGMIADGKPAKEISAYVIGNKIRNITGNHDLNDDQVQLMVDLLDEVSPKGVFKQLNEDIRLQLKKNK